MLCKKILLLLLLVHTAAIARGKRRIHKRDAVDPLLSEIFNSANTEVKPAPVKDTRPDRSIDPNEELEALLTGFQNRNKHLFPQNSPAKRESGPEPTLNGFQSNADQFMSLNAPVNTRDMIPQSPDNLMLGAQIPSATGAQLVADPNQNFMEQTQHLNQQQAMLNGIAAASLIEPQPSYPESETNHQIQGRNIIPGRPNQKKNDWANQPGVTVYLHADKKSTIPIPVKAEASAAANPGSFPLQMRRHSPNMNIGAIVPHHSEFGETVESIMSKPEQELAKKSEIPHPKIASAAPSERSEVPKEPSVTITEAKKDSPNAPDKKDFLQQPFNAQQFPQQQPAYQTMSQFAATQGSAAFVAAAAPVIPSVQASPAQPCEDQYKTCADFAKNNYCTKYPEQMAIQCRKACKYCVAPVVPTLDNKQQIAPAVNVTKPVVEVSSGSGSGDESSGSGVESDDSERRSAVKNEKKPTVSFLPDLGTASGSGSGSGSGDDFPSGSEAAVVRQLASAQTIVSGVGQEATASLSKNSTKKTNVPLMKKALVKAKAASSGVVKKSTIPQRPVSPLTAMDTENVADDDDDDDSGSGSASGSGDGVMHETKVVKSKIPKKKSSTKRTKNAKKPKKSLIPVPAAAPAAVAPKISSAYPRIDLRKIASALAHYEEAALTLAGEYPHISAEASDLVTRSQIPRPGGSPWNPFNKLRQNIQIAKLVTQGGLKRYQIPKYLLVGEQITEKGGVASRSEIPAADSIESVAQRFAVPGVQPSLQEFYAETGKPLMESDAAKRMRIARKKKKIQKPADPFEYLRNMSPGASMEPIVDPHSKSSVRQAVSYPVYLMKVMPGSHKYVAAAPRSKVIPSPKKSDARKPASKKHSAPLPPLKPAAPLLPEMPPQSEFEISPITDANFASNFQAQVNAQQAAQQARQQAAFQAAPPPQIELGPPVYKTAPAISNANNAIENAVPQNSFVDQAMAVHEPQINAVENAKQAPPSLRTKMLSAFFQNKNGNEAGGSGSGAGEGNDISTRQTIWGTGSLIPEQPLMDQPMNFGK